MPGGKFKFRAAVVLELRQRLDENAQASLGAANDAVVRAEDDLSRARESLAAACARPRAPGTDLEWYRNWMVGLRAAIARRTEEVASRHQAREEALKQALKARRDLRVIERLRKRRLREFETEVARREQRQIDALAADRHEARTRFSGGNS